MRAIFPSFSISVLLLATAGLANGCTSTVKGVETPDDGGARAPDGGTLADAEPQPQPLVPTSKLDLLFMIDNSASMGDKQEILRASAVDLVARLVNPNCVDPASPDRIAGPSRDGRCENGVLEFQPIHDLHIGVISSSLGGRGGDLCRSEEKNPTNPSLSSHSDDRAHLIARGGEDEHAVAAAQPAGFLAWFPSVAANAGAQPPPVPAQTDSAQLVAAFQDIVSGVHQYGCGFEAQLESVYRFLVQPDPFETITREGNRATLSGVDEVLLRQRRDFLRPDSVVAVVMLTDENDSTVDPLSISGQGWAFESTSFPGSPNGAAFRSSAACATNPNDEACKSCGMFPNEPGCTNKTYTPEEDNLNVRFFHMKRRFGLDPQFPISRYVTGFTKANVPNRDGEHTLAEKDYIGNPNCVNPLFAKDLPGDASGDLCKLTRGPRAPGQVFFTLIGGVPHRLLSADGTAEGGLKTQLTGDDWRKILGRDPLKYDFEGIDPHMIESFEPRAGLPAPSSSDATDPIHGREWDTQMRDLQYACTFALPAPKDCTTPTNKNSCDCVGLANPPLCDAQTKTTQVRGKAYPTIRELAVAKELGAQAVVASICPIHTKETAPGDPLFGYRPALDALVQKMKPALKK